MKTHQKTHPRYPDQHKDILNIAIEPWLQKRIKQVLKQGKKKRIAKYKNIDAYEMRVEYPVVFSRKKAYFRSTIVARNNGLCFPDPIIKLLPFAKFIQRIDPNNEIYRPDIDNITTLETFEKFIKDAGTPPETPQYTLIQIEGKYSLFVFSQSQDLDINDIFQSVFKAYRLQKLEATIIESSDEDYPKKRQDSIEAYSTGKLTLTESVLLDTPVEITLFNVNLIQTLLTYNPIYDGLARYDGTYTYSGTYSANQ